VVLVTSSFSLSKRWAIAVKPCVHQDETQVQNQKRQHGKKQQHVQQNCENYCTVPAALFKW
jgi:hypothetical protein